MERNFIIKKCNSCGAMVKVLDDCNCEGCGIQCCGKEMTTLVPNSTSAAVEKHIPTYEVNGDSISVKVAHVMEDDHFIEWLCLVTDDKEYMTYFKPGSEAVATLPYVPGSVLYAYCNKHGLWKADV